jgi:hypothetical protein
MVSDKILERGHRVIESEGWGLYLRFSQCIVAIIMLGLTIYSDARLQSWVWGPINLSFVLRYCDLELTLRKCGFTILSVDWLMTFKRGHRTTVFQ